MRLFYLFLLSLGLLFNTKTYAQQPQGGISFEAGVNLGISAIQSDFGENGDLESSVYGNIGTTFAGTFYMDFINRRNSTSYHWLKNHTKIKGEVSYTKANIDHFGATIKEDTYSAPLYKAMHGTASIISFGAIFEYHIFDISEFNPKNTNIFSPYVGVGVLGSYSSPTISSDLGDYTTNALVLPAGYRTDNSINTKSETTFSLVYSLGTRIKMNYYSDLILDTRWQQFFSDNIDGLNPQFEANKHNDWMYGVSLGYLFYLD